MTKEEVLQKVNAYCTEKAYTTATLTDGFKDKFAEHFAKRYPETDVNDENAIADMKFALTTAFSGASLIITEKTNAFTSKENEYKSQIAELQKKVKTPPTTQQPPTFEVPQDLKDQLEELRKFKDERSKQEKFADIVTLAKKGIRQDLHKSFDNYAKDYDVKLDKTAEEQANSLVARFQEIFKDSLGNIKPLAPVVTQKQEEDYIASIPKVKV